MPDETTEQIHQIIQSAVQRSGGDWKRCYRHEVERILVLVAGSLDRSRSTP